MNIIVIFVLILAVGAIIVGGIQFFASAKGEEEPIVSQPTCSTCNGDDTRCEQECMMEAATKDIEYYDDEELDKYKGRPSDCYSDEETEEFREILYTMKPEERLEPKPHTKTDKRARPNERRVGGSFGGVRREG